MGGVIHDDAIWVGDCTNSYAISSDDYDECSLEGEKHGLESAAEVDIFMKHKDDGNIYGCGLLLDPDNQLAIFFTLNGILLGEFVGN